MLYSSLQLDHLLFPTPEENALELHDLSVIRPLLEKHGFHFSKTLGQNFLIQEWVPKKIVSVSGITRDDGVLEIGPGIGVLTQELCLAAGKVVAVELDRKLLPVSDPSPSVRRPLPYCFRAGAVR